MNLFKNFVLYLASICPLFQESVQTFQADYFYLSFCPSVHCQKTWVDFHVRLFLSVHLSICLFCQGRGQTFLSDFFYLSILSREGVDFPASIFLSVRLSICPFFQERGRLSSQFILSVRLSICPFFQERGQTFYQDYFYLSVCPSNHCQKTWVDFPFTLFLSVRLSICPLLKDRGNLSCKIISISPSVHLSILKRQWQDFLSDYFYLSVCPTVHC